MEAQIISSNEYLPALPESSIVEMDNTHYVLLLEEGEGEDYEFIQKEVKPIKTFQGFTAVEDPEALEGKKVLSRGAFTLIGN